MNPVPIPVLKPIKHNPQDVSSRLEIHDADNYRFLTSEFSTIALPHKGTTERIDLPAGTITPQKGKQDKFARCHVDLALTGGGAGGGKSYSALLEPLYHIDNPEFAAVILRKTYPEITAPGGLWETSRKIYMPLGGKARENDLTWKFPSGATVKFSHMQHGMKDAYRWQGSQVPLFIIDEATHFDRATTFYLLSRNRSTCGVKPYMRFTCNPDPDSWLASFIDWWIDDDGFAIEERSGAVRHFITINDEVIWADTPAELTQKYPNALPKSFTFIPSKLSDNPILTQIDPDYRANLQALHPVERARLEGGNWKIRFQTGNVFNRQWPHFIDDISEILTPKAKPIIVRAWDLAATTKTTSYYTAGVKMLACDGIYIVLDVLCDRLDPIAGDDLIVHTAKMDGAEVYVSTELEGGSAGLKWSQTMRDRLAGFSYSADKPTGDKLQRFLPFATALSQGQVYFLRRAWTDQYVGWLAQFNGSSVPGVTDVADASSAAFSFLSQKVTEFNAADWLNAI
ncbi:terminase family protein [Leptothoe sp. ISB3NOV94-8A]